MTSEISQFIHGPFMESTHETFDYSEISSVIKNRFARFSSK
jgi:hypothetical protein